MAVSRTLLADIVRDRDWDFAAFLRAYRSTARAMGPAAGDGVAFATVSARQFDRWCAGEAIPHRANRRILSEMFDVDARELVARRRPSQDGGVPTSTTCTGSAYDASDGCRRSAAQYFSRAGSIAGEIADLEETLRGLAGTCLLDPVTAVADELAVHHDWAFAALDRRLPVTQTRRLYRFAGVAAGLLATADHDRGRPGDALAHARTVLSCANFAECPSLRAWGYALHSLITYWKGNARAAAQYAAAGMRAARAGVGSARSWLLALDARAQALLANSDRAGASFDLLAARPRRRRTDWLDAMGGVLAFGELREQYYVAEAHVLLGGGRDAERRAFDVVTAYEAAESGLRCFSDEAGARSVLALARLDRGDLGGAHATANRVLELPPSHRVNEVLVSASRLVDRLDAPSWRGSLLREELANFVAASPFRPAGRHRLAAGRPA